MDTENRDSIDRIVKFLCRRHNLPEDEAEGFSSQVKLKLIENDDAVIRKFAGRSNFSTYITLVVQRMLLDYRIQRERPGELVM